MDGDGRTGMTTPATAERRPLPRWAYGCGPGAGVALGLLMGAIAGYLHSSLPLRHSDVVALVLGMSAVCVAFVALVAGVVCLFFRGRRWLGGTLILGGLLVVAMVIPGSLLGFKIHEYLPTRLLR